MEIPRVSAGFPFVWTLADKPGSVVDDHLSGPIITDELERHSFNYLKARPCMRVRVWSLHPRLATGLFREGIPSLSLGTSLWAPLSLRTAGVTRYLSPCLWRGHVRTFLSMANATERPSSQGLPVLYHTCTCEECCLVVASIAILKSIITFRNRLLCLRSLPYPYLGASLLSREPSGLSLRPFFLLHSSPYRQPLSHSLLQNSSLSLQAPS